MARARNREINIFNIAFLDVITGAMGAFVLMVLLLAPYYSGDVKTDPHLDKAQREIQKAENDINQALRAGINPREVERLKKLLAAAIEALQESQNEIKALKYQLNELTAQNKRLKALDDRQQAQIAQLNTQIQNLWQRLRNALAEVQQMKQEVANLKNQLAQDKAQIAAQNNEIDQQAQEINYLKQHQGRSKPQQPLSPITVSFEWSCDQVSFDLYVLSAYSGNRSDKPFDPALTPTKLMNNSAYYYPQQSFLQMLLPYGKNIRSLRIIIVLRHPLGLPAALATLQSCPFNLLVTTESVSTVSDGDMELSNANPVRFLADVKIDDKHNISKTYPPSPGTKLLSSVEQDNIKKWETKKKDELFPVESARQGRKNKAVMDSLLERAKWDQMMLKHLPSIVTGQIRKDLQEVNAILGPQAVPLKPQATPSFVSPKTPFGPQLRPPKQK
jgi:phage shock protein A